MIRYEFLCGYEFGSNNGANDADVTYFRAQLRSLTSEMVINFRSLFFLERFWAVRILGIDINQTKPQLLLLSQIVSSAKDTRGENSRAQELIKGIQNNLRLKPFKIDYSKI